MGAGQVDIAIEGGILWTNRHVPTPGTAGVPQGCRGPQLNIARDLVVPQEDLGRSRWFYA